MSDPANSVAAETPNPRAIPAFKLRHGMLKARVRSTMANRSPKATRLVNASRVWKMLRRRSELVQASEADASTARRTEVPVAHCKVLLNSELSLKREKISFAANSYKTAISATAVTPCQMTKVHKYSFLGAR